MNANAIAKHQDYAFTQWPGRNRTYYASATRVKVLHVYKVESQYRQKKMTLVECQPLSNDGSPKLDSYGNEKPIITVAARQIVASWEDHLIEHRRYELKREEREREREEQNRKLAEVRAERLRLEDEQRKARQAESEKILDAFTNMGIPRDCIHVDYSLVSIRIQRYRVKEVLESLEQSTRPSPDQETADARTSLR